jgi:formylglycine-generating enzyme required for sulfatase activity
MALGHARSEVRAALPRPETLSVPSGWFRMGSASGRPDERPVRDVFVSAFCLGRTPVTRRQYAPFLAAGRAAAPPWWGDPAFVDPDQPVVGITWFDAVTFCDWLSASGAACWRLPTEAEWERAARGGLEDAPTAWGPSLPSEEVPQGPLAAPWPVGRGTPNGFGLLDMGTIVHEWCLDWYCADAYAAGPAREPRGPERGERRASRGGSWRHHVRWSPPAARSSLPPEFRYADYGFRVLLEVD